MNPYLLLPSLALSTSVIENTLYLTTIYFACKRMFLPHQHRLPFLTICSITATGKPAASLLSLAILTHLSLSRILFAPPIVLLVLGRPESSLASPKSTPTPWFSFFRHFVQFLGFVAILTGISTVSSDGLSWLWRTWGTE